MATIVLTAVGSKVGGPLGGLVGASLGSWLDNSYIYPALFPVKSDRPALDDFDFQTASEGSPINYCMGPENRVAGTIIWMSDLRFSEVAGGKGGGGQAAAGWIAYADIAIAICEGEIQSVEKIWADGKIVYDVDPDISIVDKTDLSVTAIVAYLGTWVTISASATDMSNFVTGRDVTISGFANAGNNGTFRCIKVTETYITVVNPNYVTEAEGASVSIVEDMPEIDAAKADDITFYTGTAAQTADSLIEATEGSGNVPGYRGIAYVVVENFNLSDFGNRIPQVQFDVAADATLTIGTAIGNLLERAGLSSAQYDVSGLSGSVRGYTLSGPTSVRDALAPLLVAHDIVVNENAGVLTFSHRTDLSADSVAEADLAAHDEGDDAPRSIRIADQMDVDLPSEVNVKFLESDRDYQAGTQKEQKNNFSASNIKSINLPLVLTATEARKIAHRELWQPWVQRQVISLSLPPSYVWVQENMLLSFSVDGEDYQILVKSVSRGVNGLVAVEGVIEPSLDYEGTGDSGTSVAQQVPALPEIMLFPLDIPALSDLHTQDQGGIYWAACNYNDNEEFRGGFIYSSPVGSSNYGIVVEIRNEVPMGMALEVLADADINVWDRVNTVQVRINHGTLASVTEEQVMFGSNAVLLGDEIIGFTTATLVDTDTYELSGLLRGRRGTENETSTHVQYERFVVLNDPTGLPRFREKPLSEIGSTRQYKAVSLYGEVANYAAQEMTFEANNLRPFAPMPVTGTRDGSNNLTINWTRRTRSLVDIFDAAIAPLLEPTEAYEIDVLDAPGGNVLRTIEVAAATTTTYTAAQQTTDGLTPGNPVTVVAYQMSDVVGRGFPDEETI